MRKILVDYKPFSDRIKKYFNLETILYSGPNVEEGLWLASQKEVHGLIFNEL